MVHTAISEHDRHVVIIGGGFAGLNAARGLARSRVRITLIDRRNHHLFQPMLYQVATAGLSPSDIASPIRSILRSQNNVEVVLGEVEVVNTAGRTVTLTDGTGFSYHYLVVAPGARHCYFAHPEWETLAPGLKSIDDALEIRRRVLLAFEQAEREEDPVKRQAWLTFVVIGGGPTGVEVAGALAELRSFALRRDFRRIDPREATILLVEGGREILASYPANLACSAKRMLRRLGIDVKTETLVTAITEDSVSAGGWIIATRTVVWAAGNETMPMLATIGAGQDRQGRVLVNPDSTIPGHSDVYVVGDAAAVPQADGTTLPGLGPVAIQAGRHAARCIKADLAGEPRPDFHYRDKGQLAVIGRGHAVADFGRIRFKGFLAWVTWAFVHIFFLIGFRNRFMVMFQWAWQYFTYQSGARLITGIRRERWK